MKLDKDAFDKVRKEVESALNLLSTELKDDFEYYSGKGEKDRFEAAMEKASGESGVAFPRKYNKTSKCERYNSEQKALYPFKDINFVEKYLDFKKLQKINSTFIKGVEKHLVQGVLHPKIHTLLDT